MTNSEAKDMAPCSDWLSLSNSVPTNDSTKVVIDLVRSFFDNTSLQRNRNAVRMVLSFGMIEIGLEPVPSFISSGIAATDILQIAVHGVDTVPTGTLWDWLEAYIKKEEVEKIVIGHPTHADGNAVSFMNQIIGLERKIKKTYPHIVVVLHDEAFSSVRAKQVILASGVGQKKRKDKSLVDKVAAILILQDYLRY